jgi:tetratricopeptide (TPR) repeat protein
MQMGLSEYPRAIHECNLSLEVTPKYSKALLKRARCYEALNRLDLALRDVSTVLKMEPNNFMASEISERVKKTIEQKGLRVNDTVIELPPEYVEPPVASSKLAKQKTKKKKGKKVEEKKTAGETEQKMVGDEVEGQNAGKEIEYSRADSQLEGKKAEDKVVVEEKLRKTEEPKKSVKLVFGEDIRWAQLPINCNLLQLREVIADRFPGSEEILIKYRDHEGDLVTITSDEELRGVEASAETQVSVKLYLVEANPKKDPFFDRLTLEEVHKLDIKQKLATENGNMENGKLSENRSYCFDEWLVEFAKLFKNHVGFDSDSYLGLHELGMKVYSDAMEETVTSEEAQDLFNTAASKFQEMAALALFNWGNIHMSRARKRLGFTEEASRESILKEIGKSYDWAQKEYIKAGKRYEEALRIKPDFYEGLLAQAQQQFERAKLSWYYAIGNNVDLETWPSEEVIQLYNMAEENMEKGMEMWEEFEAQHLNISSIAKVKSQSQKTGSDKLFKDVSSEDATERARNMRSQINLLWGTILYERSIMEFKLGLPVWQECLEVAIEKFHLAGASPTDIAVMIKNHVSNDNALEGITFDYLIEILFKNYLCDANKYICLKFTIAGLGFRIDEIVQAWKEMHEAKRWRNGVPTFRLEPLLRRRVSDIYHALEIL